MYLLIRTDDEKFFRREIDPEIFEVALKHVTKGSKLEQVRVSVGGEAYDYFVTTEDARLRPKLMGIEGVVKVLGFDTKPVVG